MAAIDKLTALGGAIRAKTGLSNLMTLDEMANIINTQWYSVHEIIDSSVTTVKTKCNTIGGYAFYDCGALTVADLENPSTINSCAFCNCQSLSAVIIRSTSVPMLNGNGHFDNTLISSGDGYIYVPSKIIDSYINGDGWSVYADKFRAIKDYPDITGGVEPIILVSKPGFEMYSCAARSTRIQLGKIITMTIKSYSPIESVYAIAGDGNFIEATTIIPGNYAYSKPFYTISARYTVDATRFSKGTETWRFYIVDAEGYLSENSIDITFTFI